MNNKSIGIITFHNEKNYGAILQNYALQYYLKSMGYNDVYTINYIEPTEKYIKDIFVKNNKSFYIKRFFKVLVTNFIYFNKNFIRNVNFKKFINKNINLYGKYKNEKELKLNPPKLDVYITGSDQVWNTKITNGLKDVYTLNFGNDNTIRMSYAASLGNKEIESNEINDYKYKINKINYISVREESARNILSNILNKNVEVVLDPTLLLSKDDWLKIIDDNLEYDEKYILVYDLEKNDKLYTFAQEIAKILNLKIINFRRKKIKNVISKYHVGPDGFLNLFNNTELVITNSFHGLAFSLIFEKDFFIFPHSKTFSRTENLLEKVNLTNRIIKENIDYDSLLINRKIDYHNVKEKILLERKKSIEFLKKIQNGEYND